MEKKNYKKYRNFLIAALLILGILLILNYCTSDQTKDKVGSFLGLDSAQTSKPESASSKDSSEIAIPGFEKLVFQADTLTQTVAFENPEENTVYFLISLSIENEIVYQSQLIEPGKGVYSIDLTKTFPAGEYDGIITYATRSLADSNISKNGANIIVPVIFE